MQTTLDFLKKIAKNNSKEWFDANRKLYDEGKGQMETLVKKILGRIEKFDPAVSGIEAKKCLFRINRDVRFSKDKSPYKINMGASMAPGGKKLNIPGYYLHIEPGKSFIAGGYYMPVPEDLVAIRQEIDYNGKEFKKILSAKDFKAFFDGLSDEEKVKTAPKGYDKDHPDIELLKNKHFIVIHYLSDKQVLDPKFDEYAAKAYKAMYPFCMFLRKAVEK